MCNICKICLPQAIGDVISSIGIGIGTAAADSIGYRSPERYRSNPNCDLVNGDIDRVFLGNKRFQSLDEVDVFSCLGV